MRNPNLKALCVGTNVGPGAPTLRFAQRDAVDVATFLSGEIGTFPPVDYLLAPTCVRVRQALRSLVGTSPDAFVFYNSGHGSKAGILLADGILGYTELAERISAIGATHSLLLLDVCHAASYLQKEGALGDVLGAVDLDYIDVLAQATPGARVYCSVGANRNASEGQGVANGHFTASMFEAASLVPGGAGRLIEDRALFSAIEQIAVKRWRQRPYASGLTGDLPIVYDQRVALGGAVVIGTDFRDHGFAVSALVSGRTGVPTRWRAELVNRQGRVLAASEKRFMPYEDNALSRAVFAVPHDRVMLDPMSQMHLLAVKRAPLAWRVFVEDLRGRVLDSCEKPFFWMSPRRSA